MKAFCAALGFLTIVPLPRGWAGGEKELCRGVWFFPVVGMVIGAAAAVFPPLLAAATISLLLVLASGGLGTAFSKDPAAVRWSAVTGLVLFFTASVILLGVAGVVGAFLTLAFALVFCRYVNNRIGGYTGDTLGAICELSEIMPALVAAAITKGGA